MFLEDHDLLYFAKKSCARLVLIRRSLKLNLKLVLFVYLLLLQAVVLLDRYGQVFTKDEFVAYEKWRYPNGKEDITADLTFFKQRRHILVKELILIDLLRPVLLGLLLTVRNKYLYYLIVTLLLFLFRNDSSLLQIGFPQPNCSSFFTNGGTTRFFDCQYSLK